MCELYNNSQAMIQLLREETVVNSNQSTGYFLFTLICCKIVLFEESNINDKEA